MIPVSCLVWWIDRRNVFVHIDQYLFSYRSLNICMSILWLEMAMESDIWYCIYIICYGPGEWERYVQIIAKWRERERWAMIRTFQFLFNSCILQHGHYLGDLGGAILLQSGYVAIVFMILSQLIGFIAMVSANNNPNCTPEILFINSSNRYIISI